MRKTFPLGSALLAQDSVNSLSRATNFNAKNEQNEYLNPGFFNEKGGTVAWKDLSFPQGYPGRVEESCGYEA